MPIYEYHCKSCGHELEELQRMSDPVLTQCPSCEQSELKRLVSAAGFRLKGSGWYETDFKKGSKKNLHDTGDSGDGTSRTGATAAKSTTKSAESKSAEAKSTSKGPDKAASKKTDAA